MSAANRFVLSGGPGGGKSALLAALAERGYPVASESARAIIRSRLQAGLAPRPEPAAFAQAIFQQDAQHYQQSQALGSVRKVPALGDASLKTGSECSFTARKLRVLPRFLPRLTFARRLFVENLDTPCFFDRSVLDALYMLHAAGAMDDAAVAQQCSAYPYNRTVFFLPPWQAIYQTDGERDQTFSEAQQVYANLKRWYLRWGYDVVDVPCCSVPERVAFVLHAVTQAAEQGGAE